MSEDLTHAIAFALSQHGYQPPRSKNPAEREAYFLSVARAVEAQILKSFEVTKKPPRAWHECHPPASEDR